MSVTSAFIAWKMANQISPIILTGGIAAAQGGALPIVKLTNPSLAGVSATATSVSIANPNNVNLDNLQFNYRPLPGSTLIAQDIAHYPFANQAVAANAVISQPLRVSMAMICPAGDGWTFAQKLTTLTALIASLKQHNAAAGLYTVISNACIYQNCVMLGIRDISGGPQSQDQEVFAIDFEQPLITQAQATQALNGLMQTITNATPPAATPGSATGLPVGSPASSSVLTPNQVPM